MTLADLHPCTAGCGRDSVEPGLCETCDRRARRSRAATLAVREGPCLADEVAPINGCAEGEPADAIEIDVRYWAQPGILRRIPDSDAYVETYLPALVPYMTEGLRPRYRGDGTDYVSGGFEVRLPEGPKGRLERFPTEIRCLRSPAAAAPCEGDKAYPAPDSREHASTREGARGHRWGQGYAGTIYCVRCRCSGALAPLTWVETHPSRLGVDLCRGSGDITCVIGDATTRRQQPESILTTPPPSRDARRIDVTPPSQRAAILARAFNPFDAGGRWLLPDDVTPESAPPQEDAHWLDLGEELLACADDEGRSTWAAWLAGEEPEAPPRAHWVTLWRATLARIAPHLLEADAAVYVDARALLGALRRTGVAGTMVSCRTWAEQASSDLRALHEERRRGERCSLLVLFPEVDPAADRECGLDTARRVWGSGR